MSTLTPKKREIKDRERRILAIARPMIVREGYHGLNMDRIAEKLKYSKGTIYNHFSCKEEIVIALAIENAAKRVELFQKAAQFKGPPRHRMNAIGLACEIFVQAYPDYFQFERILNLPSVREKTSEKRQSIVRDCELGCMSIVAGLVRDGIAAEDLVLAKKFTPEKLVFGLWSLVTGAYSIALSSDSLTQMGLDDPFAAVHDHTSALMDGFDWQPLSDEYDLTKLHKKIQKEVFKNE